MRSRDRCARPRGGVTLTIRQAPQSFPKRLRATPDALEPFLYPRGAHDLVLLQGRRSPTSSCSTSMLRTWTWTKSPGAACKEFPSVQHPIFTGRLHAEVEVGVGDLGQGDHEGGRAVVVDRVVAVEGLADLVVGLPHGVVQA